MKFLCVIKACQRFFEITLLNNTVKEQEKRV